MTPTRLVEVDVSSTDLLRWSMAGVAALTAHAMAIAGYLLLHQPVPSAAGAPVVLVELAAVPSAPEVESLDIPDEKPAQKSEPEPMEMKAPEEPPQKLPEVSEPAAPIVTAPPPKPVVKPKKPPAPRTVASARAPNHADAASGPQIGVTSAETRAAQASWRDLLAAHLQRHKRYPDSARARREAGVVMLGFAMDRNGHVLSRRIVRSSGSEELDREALDLVRRAQPLPALPPAMAQTRMDLTVPLQFSLR